MLLLTNIKTGKIIIKMNKRMGNTVYKLSVRIRVLYQAHQVLYCGPLYENFVSPPAKHANYA